MSFSLDQIREIAQKGCDTFSDKNFVRSVSLDTTVGVTAPKPTL